MLTLLLFHSQLCVCVHVPLLSYTSEYLIILDSLYPMLCNALGSFLFCFKVYSKLSLAFHRRSYFACLPKSIARACSKAYSRCFSLTVFLPLVFTSLVSLLVLGFDDR